MKKQDYFNNRYRTSSIRMQGWDYSSAGRYFVTICTRDKISYFGNVIDSKMELNPLGEFAFEYLSGLNSAKEGVKLIIHVVMPNHLHAIIELKGKKGNKTTNSFGPLQSGSLSSILNQYKGRVTKYAKMNGLKWGGWQPKFHDHIIRNEHDFENIYQYILNNPAQWKNDRYYQQ